MGAVGAVIGTPLALSFLTATSPLAVTPLAVTIQFIAEQVRAGVLHDADNARCERAFPGDWVRVLRFWSNADGTRIKLHYRI
jgi:hypothetical protein